MCRYLLIWVGGAAAYGWVADRPAQAATDGQLSGQSFHFPPLQELIGRSRLILTRGCCLQRGGNVNQLLRRNATWLCLKSAHHPHHAPFPPAADGGLADSRGSDAG